MHRFRNFSCATLALALLAALPAVHAADRGTTPGGEAYVMGGIGLDEVEALQQERDRYTLWVRTAARGSGEYLADVQVLIADAQGRAVFHQPLTGPWLLIDLPPGNYVVQASWHGASQSQRVHIAPKARRDVVFYFSAQD